MLTREQKQTLHTAMERAITIMFCALVVCLIVAILAQMNAWHVAIVVGAFLAGVGCSFYFTALVALDVVDDENKEVRHD